MGLKLRIFSNPSILTFVLDAQKNSLIETVLLRTHNICICREIRKLTFDYALMSRGQVMIFPLRYKLNVLLTNDTQTEKQHYLLIVHTAAVHKLVKFRIKAKFNEN